MRKLSVIVSPIKLAGARTFKKWRYQAHVAMVFIVFPLVPQGHNFKNKSKMPLFISEIRR